MKQITAMLSAALIVLSLGPTHAGAADYTFKAKDGGDFYRSTLYADRYGSEYNYGGPNVTDFYDLSRLPGLVSPTPQTAGMTGSAVSGAPASYNTPAYSGASASFSTYTTDFTSYTAAWNTAFTPVSELVRADGSIGTLSIPSLSISMKAYEGTGSASLDKGVGHFTDTSGWNGNICLAGHNRGAAYAIGTIKNLKIGDTIRYTTVYGTRSYSVSYVGTIPSTDWSLLSATADNRISIITCLADQPSLRVCVQAKEIL